MIDPAAPDFSQTPFLRKDIGPIYQPHPRQGEVIVSIVTPFYNTGAEFLETVACVKRQTLQHWEWIVVDDCSTDVVAVGRLHAIAKDDARIRILRLDHNGGPGKARNQGILAAKADYIFQLDSDDLIEPTAIEKLLWFLAANPDVAFARGYEVGFGAEEYLWAKGFHSGAEFLNENLVQTNSMIRKSVFTRVGGYDESIRHGYEDWDFWLRCANAGLWGNTVPEYLHWYRRRQSHADRWLNFSSEARKLEFRRALHAKYSGLTATTFPQTPLHAQEPYGAIFPEPGIENVLLKQKRRLLFIVPHYEMGGADKFNLDLIEQLVCRFGWEVTVVSTLSSASAWISSFARYTSDIFILPNLFPSTVYPSFLKYLIRSRDHDAVLISNSSIGYQLTPFIRSNFPDIPLLDYVHMEEEYWKSGGYARYSINYGPFLTRTMVSSHHLKNWMLARGKPADSVSVVYTGINPACWSRALNTSDPGLVTGKLRPDCVKILFAARLCDQKQPNLFLRIARRLIDERSNIQFIAAGDGEYRPHFEQLNRDTPGDRFLFLGAQSQSAIKTLLSQCQLFLLPSKMEGISLSVYEAMSMGVVPICANVGGQAELVDGDSGILIERGPQEFEAYCTAIRRLVDAPKMIERMAAAARQRIVDHFSLDIMGDKMAQALTPPAFRHPLSAPIPSTMADLFTIEIVEQQRLENLASQLWRQVHQPRTALHPGAELTVFIDKGLGYNEQDTKKLHLSTNVDLDLWLPLDTAISGGRLRIDPVATIGMVYIKAIYLRCGINNNAFWFADSPSELSRQLEIGGTAKILPDPTVFTLFSFGDDPIIYLPYVVPENPTDPVMFHIQMRFEQRLPAELFG